MPEYTVSLTYPLSRIEVEAKNGFRIVEIDCARNEQMEKERHQSCQAAIETTMKNIERQLENNNHQLTRIRQQMTEITIQFAEDLARTLFSEDVALHQQRLRSSIVAGMTELDVESSVKLWVNGAGASAIVQEIVEGQSMAIEVCDDPLLQPGDCRLETENDGLIARLENQLECVRDKILLDCQSEQNDG